MLTYYAHFKYWHFYYPGEIGQVYYLFQTYTLIESRFNF